MNRSNIWVHLTVAVVLITLAAVLGQIRRWENALTVIDTNQVPAPARMSKAHDATRDVLVKFKPGVSLQEIKQIAARNNDRLEDEIESVRGLVLLDDLDNADVNSVIAQYRSLNDVAYAEANNRIELDDPSGGYPVSEPDDQKSTLAKPNDPDFDQQWALNNLGQDGGKQAADISALKAWETTRGSTDVVVAVLDSGVDYTHVDLSSNMWVRPDGLAPYFDDELGRFNDIQGFDATDQASSDPMDDNGHGTHVAGIIGAEGDNDEGIAGINWNVRIMPLKFLGRGGFGTTADAIKAINYAIDRKSKGVNLRVINASWGSTQYSKALEDAIKAAGDAGILFVAAAGNNGSDNDKRPHYPSNYDLPNVISVAATDRDDALASFSNYGVKTVQIAAPGRDIESTWLGNAYRDASGTSMAAPHVSGVAALVLSTDPDLSVAKLREKILNSVDKLPALAGKISSGGRLNAAKAVE